MPDYGYPPRAFTAHVTGSTWARPAAERTQAAGASPQALGRRVRRCTTAMSETGQVGATTVVSSARSNRSKGWVSHGLMGWRFAAPLDPALTAVPELRHRLQQELPVERGREEVTLVAGELATNAILHGAPPVAVQVTVADDDARVEVRDGLAAWREPTKESRGILLVDALACGWGVYYDADRGKRVWADIPAHVELAVQNCTPQ
jgi:hypothetical protein